MIKQTSLLLKKFCNGEFFLSADQIIQSSAAANCHQPIKKIETGAKNSNYFQKCDFDLWRELFRLEKDLMSKMYVGQKMKRSAGVFEISTSNLIS